MTLSRTSQKSVWLAFRPDLTPFPRGFTHAVVDVYPSSDWASIKNLLEHDLADYIPVAAIAADAQADRLAIIRKAEDVGFRAVELDEQVSRDTLSAKELNQIMNLAHIPVGITGPPEAIHNRVSEQGMSPSFICPEFYDDPIGRVNLIAPLREIYAKPIIGVVALTNKDGGQLFDVSMEVWERLDGVWFWGLNAANPEYNAASAKNINTLRSLLDLFGRR